MKKVVEYRTPYGAYRSSVKVFSSEKHFNNWYTKMNNLGYKIEGVYAIHDNQDAEERHWGHLATWQERFSY